MEPRNAVAKLAGKEVNRLRPKEKRGPRWSRDPFDKMIAAMTWWRAWYRNNPEYIGAEDYYDAILKWYRRLSPHNVELCGTVYEVYVTPSCGGPKIAEKYAADLPPVPVPPDVVREEWERGRNWRDTRWRTKPREGEAGR
jgi:hypothetical protein